MKMLCIRYLAFSLAGYSFLGMVAVNFPHWDRPEYVLSKPDIE